MPSKSSQRQGERFKESKEESRHQNSAYHKEHVPDRNSTELSTSFSRNGPHQHTSCSYTQVNATNALGCSQYQAGSISGLPPARSWPNYATVPCQTRLDHDLLGLNRNLNAVDYSLYRAGVQSEWSIHCPYHPSVLQANFPGEISARGLGGIDRFIAEAPSEHGAVYFHEDVLNRASGCYCLETLPAGDFSLDGFVDEEFVVL